MSFPRLAIVHVRLQGVLIKKFTVHVAFWQHLDGCGVNYQMKNNKWLGGTLSSPATSHSQHIEANFIFQIY